MITRAKIIKSAADFGQYSTQESRRGTHDYIMSNSALTEFATCPARWVAGYKRPESDATRWGSLLDTAWLTPDKFSDRYAVTPKTYTKSAMKCPSCGSVSDALKCAKCKVTRVATEIEKEWNGNSTECREWESAQDGKTIISPTEAESAEVAISRLNADATIAAFYTASQKQVWVSGFWQDSETGIAIPLRGLLDLAPARESEFADCLADLKSTRNAALLSWQRWCYQARYHWQAAIYTDLWNAATGDERTTFCFIVQENFPPYQTAKRMLSQDFLTLGRCEYRAALALYAQCLRSSKWPDYDATDEAVQGWTLVAPEPWMAQRAQFGPQFTVGAAVESDSEFESEEPT